MSIRAAFSVLFCLKLLVGVAEAGQSSAGFSVGITIGKPALIKISKAGKTYTWNAAAISVRRAGFDGPVRLGADTGSYWFMAERGGHRYRVAVSKTTGAIVKVFTV